MGSRYASSLEGRRWVEQVVDFGHAKQFFKDADVFPSFLIVRRPVEGSYPQDARVCVIPRDMVRIDHLKAQVLDEGNQVSPDRFDEKPWSLEIPDPGSDGEESRPR